MRLRYHFVIAVVLALLAAFSFYIWHASGWSCGISSCSFRVAYANPSFFSVGVFLVFLTLIEIFISLRVIDLGASIVESASQKRIRKIGSWFVVIGLFMTIIGLYMLNALIVMCPVNGCSQSALWQIYGLYLISFYGGQIVAGSGAVMILLSKFTGFKPIAPEGESPKLQ